MAQTKVKLISDGVIVQSNLHASHGITTAHIGEGSNLYYTDARSRAAISVSGNALSYNSSTGVITSNFEESPTFTGDVLIGTSTTTPSTHYNNLVIEDVAGNNVGISLISGTGNNTALYFGDSADTDVAQLKYSHATNTMFFVVNASEAMRIDSSGNVGIGTTSPSVKLEVLSSQSNSSIRTGGLEMQSYAVNNSWYAENLYYDGAWKLRNNGHATQMYMEAGVISFKRVASGSAGASVSPLTTMVLNSDGNIGIGTTSPGTKLDVDGTIRLSTSGRVEGRSYPYTTNIGSTANATTTNITAGSSDKSEISLLGGDVGDRIEFKTNSTERMRIDSSGNVGIGMTAPQSNLHVFLDGTSGETAHFGSHSNVNASGQYCGISLGYRENNALTYSKVKIVAEGVGDGAARQNLHFLVDTASDGNSAVLSDSKMSIQYNTGNVIINNNLGIGETSPNAKLDVSGNVKLGSAAHSSWTDAKQDLGGVDIFVGSGSKAFQVWDDNQQSYPRFIVERTGNVGIGVASPGKLFSVVGADGRNSTTYLAEFVNADNTSDQGHGVLIDGGNNANHHLFQVNAQNSAVFAVKGNGYVGIGTTSPAVPLHVNHGSSSVALYTYGGFNHQAKFESADAEAAIIIQDSNSTNNGNRIGVITNDMTFITNDAEKMRIGSSGIVYIMGATPSTNNSLQMQYNSTAGSAEIYAKSTGGNTHFEFYTSNSGSTTEKMRINHLGNVGIGTTSPSRHLDIREQEQTYSGVLKLSSAWTGSNVWVERLFAASFIRQTQEIGVDLLSLGSISGNSHVLIEVSILAVAATAQQSAKITFFAGARQTSGGSYGNHYVTNPVVTAIQGSNISAGTPAWQGNTLIYTTYSQSNYTRYQVDFRVTCHDYMNITFEL